MWNYLLPITASLFAVLQLVKDWQAHQTSWRRITALILILLLGVGTAINNHYASKHTIAQHTADLKEIKDLKDAIHDLEEDWKKVQKPPGPGPKASLAFSFSPIPNQFPIVLVTDKNLPINSDGSVHVEYSIVNATDVDAMDSELNFQIGAGCRFAKEPDGLSRLPGLADRQRYLWIHILSPSVPTSLRHR